MGIVKPAAQNLLKVGLSEFVVSDEPSDVLATYSLGSCVGVVMYDPKIKLAGMIHCLLPHMNSNTKNDQLSAISYVDTGVVILLQTLYDRGAQRKNIICKVAGCGSKMDADDDIFRVGERNFMVLRKVLWKNNIYITSSLVGGHEPKSMFFEVGTGQLLVKNGTEYVHL